MSRLMTIKDIAVAKEALEKERERCWIIAHDRSIACQASAKRYAEEYPNEPNLAATERCAHMEADYIARKIHNGDQP